MSFLISAPINFRKFSLSIGFLSLFVLILGCSSQDSARRIDEPYYRELSLFRRAGNLLEDGQYPQAGELYKQFSEKYPKHPYADDAAYRIAYLHVISDPDNPYYNYHKARILFEKFIENYKNSHYITACKNWISLIDICLKSPYGETKERSVAAQEPSEQLLREIEKLRAENNRLNQDLEQLQQALER